MKITLYVSLFLFTLLLGCQDEQRAQSNHSAAPTSTNPSVQNDISPKASTVAVLKPEKQHAVQDLQASLSQSKESAAKAIAQLIDDTATAPSLSSTAKSVAMTKPAEITEAVVIAKAVELTKVVKTAQAASPTGDAVKGKKLARKCMTCHNFSDKKKVGPGLQNIVGREAGSMPGMKYAKALAAGGWVWNEQNLAGWLCDSKKSIKVLAADSSAKTKMPAQRICDPSKQADMIAFLKTL